jgi:hypothetical protein
LSYQDNGILGEHAEQRQNTEYGDEPEVSYEIKCWLYALFLQARSFCLVARRRAASARLSSAD